MLEEDACHGLFAIELPIRMELRKDSDAPKPRKSNTEIELTKRDKPYTAMEIGPRSSGASDDRLPQCGNLAKGAGRRCRCRPRRRRCGCDALVVVAVVFDVVVAMDYAIDFGSLPSPASESSVPAVDQPAVEPEKVLASPGRYL